MRPRPGSARQAAAPAQSPSNPRAERVGPRKRPMAERDAPSAKIVRNVLSAVKITRLTCRQRPGMASARGGAVQIVVNSVLRSRCLGGPATLIIPNLRVHSHGPCSRIDRPLHVAIRDAGSRMGLSHPCRRCSRATRGRCAGSTCITTAGFGLISTLPTRAPATWLTQFSDLPPAATRVLLAPDGHQQLHVEPTCIYGIFADLIYELDGATREIGFLHFALTERALISARRHAMTAAEGARQALLGGSKLTSVAALLEMIVEQVIASINSCADQLAEEMDAIEVELLSQKVSDQRTRLTRIRKAAVYLHRQLTGLNSLFQRCGRELDSDARPHLRVPTRSLAAAPSGD